MSTPKIEPEKIAELKSFAQDELNELRDKIAEKCDELGGSCDGLISLAVKLKNQEE